jgi:hypothetical protein
MIYKAHQIALWPRLLKAAEIDSVLRGALQELMEKGALLEANMQTGGLSLSPGTMAPDEYQAIRVAKLAPRGAKMQTVLQTARTMGHPWSVAVMQAYNDLSERCEKARTALVKAIATGKPEDWNRIAPSALDRFWQAMSLARALLDSGKQAYWDHCSQRFAAVQDLATAMEKGGLTVDKGPRFWPVQTPDGWLWVTDAPVEDQAAALGQIKPLDGMHAPAPGEPVITDWDLGQALSPIEIMQQREAG